MKKKALLSLLLISVLAFGVGMGSYAYFTSQATSNGNSFSTGTLEIASPGAGALTANLEVGNIYPSFESDPQTVTISNTGSLDLKYKVSVLPSNSILYTGDYALQVKILAADGTVIQDYTPIDELGSVEIPGSIATGGTGTFQIQYLLPAEADDAYQGKTANFTFQFDATQVNNYDAGWNPAHVAQAQAE